jgi:large repetitive protein
MFNGEKRLAMIQRLITPESPLVLGKPGRSVTIPDGSEQCIIDRLPAAGWPSQMLNVGNGTLAPGTCNTSTPLLLRNGRFLNVLLGQTIALSLNTRLDPHLSGVGLCGTMVTSAGRFTISQKVRTALTNQGLSQTVGGLLELANRALAYGCVGGASVSEINCAVNAINTEFDGCRTLLSCY